MNKQKDMLKRTLEKEIANILIKDIENIPSFITLRGVLLSEDGKNALVSISVLDASKEEAVLKRLQSAKDYIRHLLFKRIKAKNLPRLDFVITKES